MEEEQEVLSAGTETAETEEPTAPEPEMAEPEMNPMEAGLLALGIGSEAAAELLAQERRERELEEEKERLTGMARNRAVEEFTVRQVAELQRAYPDCGVTAESLTQDEVLGTLWAKLGDLTGAYRLTHFEELMSRSRAAARQQAANELRGRRQMDTGGAAGSEGCDVKAEDLANLQRMLPGRNERELREMLLRVSG